MKTAQPGLHYSGQVWPKPSDLASAIGNTGVDVVSSPATIGYLEFAALYAVEHLFEEGEASVGTGFDMKHMGAAVPEKPVDVSSELIAVDGIKLTFKVEASQSGKLIMTGTHERAVVNLARLLAGAGKPGCAGSPVVLTGRSLTIEDLVSVATQHRKVVIAPECTDLMARGRAIVDRHFTDGIAVYGLNTGLGMRATETLSWEEAADFSARTVRGRAQAVGQLLPEAAVRAAMLVRLNTLLTGEAGCSLHIADALVEALNAGFIPAMPGTGSVGAGDLVVMAAIPHALMGEGEATVKGQRLSAADALKKCGLKPVQLGPKDGLVLCNSPAHSVSLACLAAHKTRVLLNAVNASAAMVMEGFRANVSPLLAGAAKVRPQPGQVEIAAAMRRLLEGSGLFAEGSARRLQDPISIRSLVQTNGSLRAALDVLDTALAIEINHAADNPVVLLDEGKVVSTGNYHTPWLTQALDLAARALAVVVNDTVSRVHRLCSPELSGLAPLLSSAASDRAGFGPLLKPLEALRANVLHLANATPITSSHNANGVEDAATFTPLAATRLGQMCEQASYVIAFELLAGAQAVDLARPQHVAARVHAAHKLVRQYSARLDEDRPIGREVEAIACELVLMGGLDKAYR